MSGVNTIFYKIFSQKRDSKWSDNPALHYKSTQSRIPLELSQRGIGFNINPGAKSTRSTFWYIRDGLKVKSSHTFKGIKYTFFGANQKPKDLMV